MTARSGKLICRIFFVLTVLLFLPIAAFAAQDPVFTVEGVKVDVTAESAAAARNQAFGEAQQVAFRTLAERLLPEQEKERFTLPDADMISSMVNDFEVTNEKLSHVRYIGIYTFRFADDKVRSYLSGSGLSFTDVGSKPVLVIPFYQWGGHALLWQDGNPWLAAWSRQASSQGLVPVAVPIGDLQDVSDIADDQAQDYILTNVKNMARRYRAGNAIIMLAIPGWADSATDEDPDTLQVVIYNAVDGPQTAETMNVNEGDRQSNETIFDTAARKARENLQKDWKRKTVTSAAEGNKLKTRARFTSMQEWVDLQKTLRRVQGLNDVQVLSLTPREANIEFRFAGNEDRLRLALSQADITLTSPQINFGSMYGGESGPPLVYEIYLNRYRADQPAPQPYQPQ